MEAIRMEAIGMEAIETEANWDRSKFGWKQLKWKQLGWKQIGTEANWNGSNWDGSKLEWNQIGSRGHLGQASPRKPHFGRSLELEFIWEAKIGSVPGRTPPRPGNRSFQAQERQRLSSVVQVQLGGEVEPGCEEFSCFEDKRLRTKTKTKGRGETCRLAKGQSLLFLVAGRIQGCNFLQHPHAGPWKPCGNGNF